MNHDIHTTNPNPINREMTMAMDVLTKMFPDKNITFFMTDFEQDGGRMYYASNGKREDMMKALQQYITAHQNHG